MKKLKALVIAVLLGSTALISSCNKYEEGPKFSLLTKKARLTREWDLVEYQDGESGVTAADNSSDYAVFENNGDYKAVFDNVTYNGTWDFSNKKEDLSISFSYGGFSVTTSSQILRLTNDELWLKDEDNNISRFKAK